MVEGYDIQIKEDGSRVVSRNMDDMANAIDKAANAVDRLIDRLKAVKGVLDPTDVRAYTQAWGAASQAMQRARKDADDLARAMDRVNQAAKAAARSSGGTGGTGGGGRNYPLATTNGGGGALVTMQNALMTTGQGGGMGQMPSKFMGMAQQVSATTQALNAAYGQALQFQGAIQGATQAGVTGFTQLQQVIAGVVAYLGVSKLIEYADAWAMLAGRVAVATKSQEEAEEVTERLYQIAVKTRTPIQEMSALYQNLQIASKNLGNSQEATLEFTDLIGKSLAVQKVPAQTARGALLQLGQALDSGRVRAQEFNSVNMGIPYVMKIAAENIKGADGSIAKLRQQMLAGNLSSREFFEAIIRGGATINADFAKTRQTFAQTFTVMENGLARYIGKLNESLGVSDAFGKSVKFIVDNIDVIGGVFLTAAAAIGAMLAPAALGGLVTLLGTAGAALLALAGPVGIALGVISGLVVGIMTLGNQFKIGTANGAGFRDLLQALWEQGTAALKGIYDAAVKYIEPIAEIFNVSFGDITFADAYLTVAKFFDYVVGAAVATVTAVIAVFDNLPSYISNLFKDMYNQTLDVLERWGNKIADQVDAVRIAMGKPVVVRVQSEKMDVEEGYFQKFTNNIAGAVQNAWDIASRQVQNAAEAALKRADDLAKARDKKAVDLTTGGGAGDGPAIDEKGYNKALNALRALVQQVAPAYAATLQLAHAEDVLNKAVEKGVIARNAQKNGFESANFYLGLVRQHYQDIANPMAKFLRETEQQTELLKLDTREREVAVAVERELQNLKKAGIYLSDQELRVKREILEQAIATNQQAQRDASTRDNVLNNSASKQLQDLKEQLAITKALQDNGRITETDSFNAAVSQTGLSQLFEGTRSAQNAQLELYQSYYERLDAMRNGDLTREQSVAQAKRKLDVMVLESKLQTTQQILGGVASLMQAGNRKAFEIGKAAAVAQATIDGVVAVQKALASTPPPYNYAVAAAVGVASAVNVAKIMSATPGFEAGGYTGNMGRQTVAGVVHGQEYVVNAAATARNRPLLEAMNRGGTIGGSVMINNYITINRDGSSESSTDGDTDLATVIASGVETKVMEIIYREKRQGGVLST